VAAEAQIMHTTCKVTNALKMQEEVAQSKEKLAGKVVMLEKELASMRKAADAAQGTFIIIVLLETKFLEVLTSFVHLSYIEESRRALQHNLALSESSLEKYRKL
jgi:structural maintenance of chromosome 1